MTDTELKRSLIAKIKQIQDPAFLKALLVITDGQRATPTKRYTWAESAARHWIERNPALDNGDNSANEDFFEDMEQLLRDNH